MIYLIIKAFFGQKKDLHAPMIVNSTAIQRLKEQTDLGGNGGDTFGVLPTHQGVTLVAMQIDHFKSFSTGPARSFPPRPSAFPHHRVHHNQVQTERCEGRRQWFHS